MPANVETMFYVREKPWHGLGTEVQEAPTSADALIYAGLDWEVIQKNVYSEDGSLIAGYKVNTRSTDSAALGIVSDRYKVVQNEDAFQFTDDLLGAGVTYETAGALQGGRKVWMLARMPAYTGPRAPSARSISPTLPERSPTIPRAVLEERPCQPRRRAEPGISHRSRGWGCRWQSKQSPVIECDSGKSVIPPAWHRRFPRIPVPLHAGSSNPIQGHRGNRRD